jgi:hypothetical protein
MRSTTSPDPILQMINDHLLTITQDLNNIRQDVTDFKCTITYFKNDVPQKLEAIDTRIAVLEQDMNHRMDALTLKTADVAVELSEFQQSTQDRFDSLIEDPLTHNHNIISTVHNLLIQNYLIYQTSYNKNY